VQRGKLEKMDKDFEIIIQPNRSWFYVDWRGLLHYRDLLFLLVRRDFLARYKQTILGPAWFILQPLLTTLVFTVIFGRVTKIPTDGLPPMMFYLCGLLAWSYFAQCLGAIASSLTSNAGLFSKVYFPRLIIPLSIVMSNCFALLLQLATFMGFYVYFKFFTSAGIVMNPNHALFYLPVLFLQSAAIALGVGLWIAALTVRYRDFQHLVPFMTQLWMYATPIIYPMSEVSEKWRWVILINPMASIVESYRFAFFGVGVIDSEKISISFVFTAALLVSGLLIFNKAERTFVDTI
jgi:lipopolysaccharide transport system permease protein